MKKSIIINPKLLLFIFIGYHYASFSLQAQSWDLTSQNIDSAFKEASKNILQDSLRPAFHLTPPAGCMGDPNGGIYHDGWYHIFYGLNPFSSSPGGWYWAHARSRDLLNWEHMKQDLTPAFELGLDHVGSGSTIINDKGKPLAFYSTGKDGSMKFWQAQFNSGLTEWKHKISQPVLSLEHPGLPEFDKFWRDPFVFKAGNRTFLIACADLFEENYVPVPIFESKNTDLTSWEYKGILFTYPKHKLRNLEVPELRPLGDKWILMASSDAPVDRCVYFIGDFDFGNMKFIPDSEGILDYSGHYYAQETILDNNGDLFLMAWMPGWDRDWLPTYMNESLKNNSPVWNGCFAIPRKLSIDNAGKLIQQPVNIMKQLRTEHIKLESRELPVFGPMTAYDVLDDIRGDQLEIDVELELKAAAFCGLNVLCDKDGNGGLFIIWSGDVINIDGVTVPIKEWKQGDPLQMQIFIDKQLVEVFINGGRYCVSRKVRAENIKGDYIALTRLGGTAKLISLEGWNLKTIN
ncbi:glycoside hydrolase family 32 protein [Bacteroidota bacterium]